MANLSRACRRFYVALMMFIIGRAMVAGSRVDADMRTELAGLPKGLTFQMTVEPAGPAFTVEHIADGELKLVKKPTEQAQLTIRFKHMRHAFLVFSFQEGTARAFANDRMYVDGEVSYSVRLVRVLDRMETLILPKFIAQRAVKRYPKIGFIEKISTAARLYGRLTLNLLKGA